MVPHLRQHLPLIVPPPTFRTRFLRNLGALGRGQVPVPACRPHLHNLPPRTLRLSRFYLCPPLPCPSCGVLVIRLEVALPVLLAVRPMLKHSAPRAPLGTLGLPINRGGASGANPRLAAGTTRAGVRHPPQSVNLLHQHRPTLLAFAAHPKMGGPSHPAVAPCCSRTLPSAGQSACRSARGA